MALVVISVSGYIVYFVFAFLNTNNKSDDDGSGEDPLIHDSFKATNVKVLYYR